MPYDIPQSGTTIRVERAGQTSAPWSVGEFSGVPGIFTMADGYTAPIVAHTSDFSLVTPTHPAHAGEFLAVFCTGLGATKPAVRAGDAASAAPVGQRVEVVIDSRLVAVAPYAGLAPGFAGLYQVNFQVASDETPGTKLLYVSAGGLSNVVQLYVQ
jgi:uncharacterized protein (TIGR03437 family)